jgi:hypothetical protein
MSTCGDFGDIIRTYVIDDGQVVTGCTPTITDDIFSCSLSGITLHDSLYPEPTDIINLGSPTRRFRDVNTLSGTSSVWTSTVVVNTPNLNLGLDLSGNTRVITADNSIIQDDLLNGGTW